MKRMLFLKLFGITLFSIFSIQCFKKFIENTPVTSGQIIIGSNSFGTSTVMFNVTTPGYYKLIESISLDPADNNSTGIKISSNNIIFDLNGYVVGQSSSNTTTGLIAIEVASNVNNVVIINGVINDIDGIGIKINSGCSEVLVENIEVINCSQVGILASSSNIANIIINNIRITKCDGSATAATEAVGLKVIGSSNLLVKDSSFNNNVHSSSKDGCGVILQDCSSCILENCEFNNNRGNNAYGFKFSTVSLGCALCKIKNSVSVANTANTGIAVGFEINSTNNIDFLNCIASSNSGITNSYGFKGTSSNYNFYDDCIAKNQVVSGNAAGSYGFYSSNGRGNKYNRCIASGNTGSSVGAGVGIGFNLSGTEKFTSLEDCKASTNDGNNGIGYGLLLNGATNCAIHRSRFEMNVGNESTDGGFGIKDSAAASNSLFVGNFASGNGKADQTAINNFDISPIPSDGTSQDKFPSIQAFFDSYLNLDNRSDKFNIEIIENSI